MLKKVLMLLIVFALCFSAVSCGNEPENTDSSSVSAAVSQTSTADKSVPDGDADVIPPVFIDAEDGELPSITHFVGEEQDLLAGVLVRDNVTADEDLVVSVSDDGGYDKNAAGVYTVTLEAKDQAGNTATATVTVTVKETVAQKTLSLKGLYIKDVADALSYTASGTKFRATDMIHVLDKDAFVEQYNTFSPDHTNNGGVPFFPNGVIIITDSDYAIRQVRIAAGELLQIEADGSVSNSGFGWTNALDGTAGGGMFKGILKDLENVIPDGGYLFFVGNPKDQACRAYLIKNLFFSGYESGGVTIGDQDVDITGMVVVLE